MDEPNVNKEFLQKILPKNSYQNILLKSFSQKSPPKKFQKKSQSKDFENIQFHVSHLEAKNPFGLVTYYKSKWAENLFKLPPRKYGRL